jgi:hypothetical protein
MNKEDLFLSANNLLYGFLIFVGFAIGILNPNIIGLFSIISATLLVSIFWIIKGIFSKK